MKEAKEYLNNILSTDDCIVISLSGGPDSMCLLSLLLEIDKKIKIIAAHVNHKVRKESDEEESFVREYCEKHNIIFESYSINEYSNKNFHDEARILRYSFLNEIMKKYKAKYLLTAHHGDDLIETILMRLERGSNLTGYIGFKKESVRKEYTILRPLIEVTKDEILNYDKGNNIPYRLDKTNYSNEYKRNQYRNEILPILKKYNKDIHKKYLKFSNELIEYNKYIESIIKENKIVNNKGINIEVFLKEPYFIQKKSIEYYIRLIQKDNLFYITDENTQNILKAIKSRRPNVTINLPNSFVGIKEYNKFYISTKECGKDYDIIFNNYYENENWVIETIVTEDNNSNYVIRLNTEETKLPIHIRTRNDGDKMHVKNMSGEKKVNDIFIENKIPTSKRDQYPILVTDDNKVLLIPGLKKSQFDKDKSQKYDIIIKCKEKR